MTMSPKDRNLDAHYLKTYPQVSNIQDSIDIHLSNVLATKTHDVKSLQEQEAYCKHIYNTLNISSVKKKFNIKITYCSKQYKMQTNPLELS